MNSVFVRASSLKIKLKHREAFTYQGRKIMMKCLLKAGSIPFKLSSPPSFMRPTMLLGIKNVDYNKMAVVATLDKDFSLVHAECREVGEGGKE